MAQLCGGPGQKILTRLRRCLTQWHGRNLYRGAGDRRPLVGRGGGMAQHHLHGAHGQIELFSHNLGKRGANAGAQVHMPVKRQYLTLCQHRNENVIVRLLIVGSNARLAWSRLGRLARRAHDQKRTGLVE